MTMGRNSMGRNSMGRNSMGQGTLRAAVIEWLRHPNSDVVPGGGSEEKRRTADLLQRIYSESLVKYFIYCSDHKEFPTLWKAERGESRKEQAEDFVSRYLSLRSEQVLQDWREYRRENRDSILQHLRNFIKADFRLYCFAENHSPYREELRHEVFGTCTLVQDSSELERELQRLNRQEFTRVEIEQLIRVAMDFALAELDGTAKEFAEMRLLAERRVLEQQPFQQFSSSLGCSQKTARRRVFRFKRRLHTVLRGLLNGQGDSLLDILEELKGAENQGCEFESIDEASRDCPQGETVGLSVTDLKRLLKEASPINPLSFFLARIEQRGGQAWVENVFSNALLEFDSKCSHLARGSSEAFLLALKERASAQMESAEKEVVLERAACLYALVICLLLSQADGKNWESYTSLSRSQVEDLLYGLERGLSGEWATRIERALVTLG